MRSASIDIRVDIYSNIYGASKLSRSGNRGKCAYIYTQPNCVSWIKTCIHSRRYKWLKMLTQSGPYYVEQSSGETIC